MEKHYRQHFNQSPGDETTSAWVHSKSRASLKLMLPRLDLSQVGAGFF